MTETRTQQGLCLQLLSFIRLNRDTNLHPQQRKYGNVLEVKNDQIEESIFTMNCLASGHAVLLKRFTAILIWFPSFPLYTTFGAFSPCSDTMFSTAKPDVAFLSCSYVNSRNAGMPSPLSSTLPAMKDYHP